MERAYALLSGFDIAQARDAGTLRVDQDFTGIPIGSGQALNNHAATLSNSMFTKAGTVIMSEQRAVRLNTGLRQFMVNLGSPDDYLRMFGKGSGTLQLEGASDAIFSEDGVVMYGNELPCYPITLDMSYCINVVYMHHRREIALEL